MKQSIAELSNPKISLTTPVSPHKRGDHVFDEKHLLNELRNYLPSQAPLRTFIHHNSLHAFQNIKFYDAIFKASKIFGYQTTLQLSEFRTLYKTGRIKDHVLDRIIVEQKGGENLKQWQNNLLNKNYKTECYPRIGLLRSSWKQQYSLDLDNLIHPLLFRILCSYLDQGISLWKFPTNESGLLASIKTLEATSFISFFKTKRVKKLLLEGDSSINNLLKILVGKETYFEQYLFDQQFAHRGWSGMIAAVEAAPDSLYDQKRVSLSDLITFELLLEMDALDFQLGNKWKPLSSFVVSEPLNLFAAVPHSELNDVLTLWQNAFEWSYYDDVLAGLKYQKKGETLPPGNKSFQALFCLDERECSIRRHIESVDPCCETLGTPGFFNVDTYFQPEKAKFYDKVCPAPVTPKYLIKEYDVTAPRKHETLYTPLTHTLFTGYLITLTLGFWAGIRLLLTIFNPKMSPAISNAFAHMNKDGQLTVENRNLDDRQNDLQIGYTVEEMAARVESLLRSVGLIKDFSPILYAIAHGSSSANNPHHGAHDCGACSGRPGSVNARAFAIMANHPQVRELLKERKIVIPLATQFIGGLHDTAADQIEFYDEENLNPGNREKHKKNKESFEKALDLNAKERSRRFASINTKMSLKKIRKAVLDRSVSMFEPRPELGHGTNSLCIIGSRNLTKGLFLDRRAFLNSYDYRTDPEGKLLIGVMSPIGPVCGGISLEYYFSRVDNHKLGAGTKLPHHVMGLIGVANSSDGDLRPGLPLQMIEVHDPVRLLVLVEHFPEIVLKSIQSAPGIYEWYANEWVHLIVIHPETGEFFYLKDDRFVNYNPQTKSVKQAMNMTSILESAKKMETNCIVDSTQENLPIYTIN